MVYEKMATWEREREIRKLVFPKNDNFVLNTSSQGEFPMSESETLSWETFSFKFWFSTVNGDFIDSDTVYFLFALATNLNFIVDNLNLPHEIKILNQP